MKYSENKIITTSQGTEPIMALLISHGIENITVDDPRDVRELILEKDKNEWDYIDPSIIKGSNDAVIIFYTEDSESGENLLTRIKTDIKKLKQDEINGHYGNDTDFGKMSIESNMLDDSWKDEWKKGIKPFKMTDSIVIKPSWEDYEQKINELVIEIDPGMAFGTGSHETTKSCAAFLEQTIKKGDDVLDIGTGSGLLSIVSHICGAKKVDGFDIDDVPVEVAKANLEMNNIKQGVNIYNGDVLDIEIVKKYDIIVSNLTSGIIIKMLPTVKSALRDNGSLILSGMLVEERDMMMSHFKENKFTVKTEIKDNEWYTVLLK